MIFSVGRTGLSELEVAVVLLMPRKALDVELGHEWIWIELLDVVNTWLRPDALEEHHCADHGRNAGGVRDTLHAGLEVSIAVRAVVPYIVGVLLTVVADTTDAAAD